MAASQFAQLVAAIAIALGVAVLYGGLLYGGLSVVRRMRGPVPFVDEILYEAGQRHRDSLGLRDRQVLVGITSLMVMALVALAWIAVSPDGTAGWPIWASWLVLILELGVLGAAGYLLYRLIRSRRPLQFSAWAQKAVGHALQKTAIRGFWTAHHVRENDRVLDHVVVGPAGVFLVTVIAKVPDRQAEGDPVALLSQGTLTLGEERITHSLAEALRNCRWLSERLYPVVGHEVPVRSILAVPGWSVKSEGDNSHLLVNERNIAMLTGWKREDAYLMKEDMAQIQAELARMARNRWLD